MFPGLDGGAGGSSYLSYVAIITQDGSNALLANMKEDTIGCTPISAAGNKILLLNTDIDFDVTKVHIPCFTVLGTSNNAQNAIFFYNGATPAGAANILAQDDGNGKLQIQINFFDATFSGLILLSDIIGNNSGFSLPEIRVYP